MAGRRNTTPLFEIVSRNGNGAPAPAERPNIPAPATARTPTPTRDAPSRPASHHVDRTGPGRSFQTPTDDSEPESSEAQSSVDGEEGDGGESSSAMSSQANDALGEPVSQRTAFALRPLAAAHRLPSHSAASPAVEREIPRTMGRISVAAGTVRLPVNYVYVGLTLTLVLVLATWTLGYMIGGQTADEKARREIESATGGPSLRDPLDQGGSGSLPARVDPSRVGDSASRNSSGNDRPITGAPASSGGVGAGLPAIRTSRTGYLGPGGFFEHEPRQTGLNYLCLVSRLPEEDAIRAIDFLARQGVVAMGLEHARSAANNRLFDLYTLEGLTRTEFAREDGSTRRDTHEALLAELGRRWRTEERGTSDFGRPQWYRFNP